MHYEGEAEMTDIRKLDPAAAYALLKGNALAVLIDVRDPVEYSFVGHPVGAVNIPFKFAPSMTTNPDFLSLVQAAVPDEKTPIFLLCRSGQRSMAAAEILLESGYQQLTNIEEGFEGSMDGTKHRSTINGWRFRGLPWEQS